MMTPEEFDQALASYESAVAMGADSVVMSRQFARAALALAKTVRWAMMQEIPSLGSPLIMPRYSQNQLLKYIRNSYLDAMQDLLIIEPKDP